MRKIYKLNAISLIVLFLFLMFCIKPNFAQSNSNESPNLKWQKAYGGQYNDYLNTGVKTSDGGYILAGSKNEDTYVIKIDSSGNLENSYSYYLPKKQYAVKAIKTRNDSIIVFIWGWMQEAPNKYAQEHSLYKFDEDGNLETQFDAVKTSSSGHTEEITDAAIASNGNILLTGQEYSSNIGNYKDYYKTMIRVFREDMSRVNVGDSYLDDFLTPQSGDAVVASHDGGFTIAGDYTWQGDSSATRLIKTDVNGNILWYKDYPIVGGSAKPVGLFQTDDNGYLIFCNTYAYKGIGYIMKVNENGDQQWNKAYKDTLFYKAVKSDDGKIFVMGNIKGYSLFVNSVVAQLGDSGKIINAHQFGGNGADRTNDFIKAPGKGFLGIGESDGFSNTGYNDGWVYRIDLQNKRIFKKPTAFNDTATTNEDINVTINLVQNDGVPQNDSVYIDQINLSNSAGYANTLLERKSIRYYPPKDFNGIDSLSYSIKDINGDSSWAEVYINVIPVNDPPSDFSLITPHADTTFTITNSNLQDSVKFKWQKSTDVDNDTLDYKFNIYSNNYSGLNYTLDTTRNKISIPYQAISKLMDSLSVKSFSLMWNTSVTDGKRLILANNGPEKVNFSSNVTEVKDQNNIPKNYSIDQNYPNPFNPTTNIKFEIPRNSNVKVTIYNSVGQKIDELFNGILSAGFLEL